MSRTVQVRRAALDDLRIVEEPLPSLGQDEARLRVESWAPPLTSHLAHAVIVEADLIPVRSASDSALFTPVNRRREPGGG